MGLRFHKSIKLGKLLKLNINKNSISLSAGVKGAHFTVNNKGKKTATVSLPGTGLSYSKTLGTSSKKKTTKKTETEKTNEETETKKDNEVFDSIKDELTDALDDIKKDIFS